MNDLSKYSTMVQNGARTALCCLTLCVFDIIIPKCSKLGMNVDKFTVAVNQHYPAIRNHMMTIVWVKASNTAIRCTWSLI
jgi:hypothetical protein